ncbi:MAG: phosphoribosylformylglycinamidine synthase subunit PurQ [Oscillospiraceae bacterium]|jgi:phosphoribosylformylglycinamidine synthase|nr:phosphoribosylformylglycinamidine synthase subunit PurQ [Oscillospiraceae bacterium]
MRSVQIKAVIPVFPGTNCEYDTANVLRRAGFEPVTVNIRDLTPSALGESISALAKALGEAKLLFIPGGFSGGDEPEGSAKYIAAIFRNSAVTDAVHELLYQRNGLAIGICNGFQALIKLGLLPYGTISEIAENSPTLTFNTVGRHIAKYVTTKVCTVNSPWLSKLTVGEEHALPISHGEGRFTGAIPEVQVAFRYVDNPNGSEGGVEGIISPDGRILGKMAHSERRGKFVGKNISGNKEQLIFESAYSYFR